MIRMLSLLLLLSLNLPSYVYSDEVLVYSPETIKAAEVIILEDKHYADTLLDKLSNAQSSILVSMYIFKTSGSRTNAPNRVKEALIKADKRGVNVKVILEEEDATPSSLNEDNRFTAEELRKGGVEVFFDSPRRRTHVKAIVVDDRYTFIGSHNLTASALQYNKELSLMIDSKEVAKKAAGYIEEMMDRAKSP